MRVYGIMMLALALASCGEKEAASDVAEGAASGEVLPGSITDDMIALDQLRSEPEPDPDGDSVSGGDATSAGGSGADAASDPAPASTAPEPTPQPVQPKAPSKAGDQPATVAPPPPVSVLPPKKND